MTKIVEQQICIKMCLKLEHSSMETIWMIQKATAMVKWWLAASAGQPTQSCITSHAEFCGKTSNHPGDSAYLQPRFGALWLLLFPKLKSPLKGKRFQIIDEIQENKQGSWWWLEELCEVPRCLPSLSYVQCFLCLVSSSINLSIFHVTWLDTFRTDDYIYIYIYILLFSTIHFLFSLPSVSTSTGRGDFTDGVTPNFIPEGRRSWWCLYGDALASRYSHYLTWQC